MRQKAGEDTRYIVLDGRMDIYSLGATFYRMMTGRLPVQDSREFVPVTAMELPYSQALKTIVGKAMEWDIRKRYPSASAMHKALLHIYRSDSAYRKLRILNICLYTGCGLLFLSGMGHGLRMERDCRGAMKVIMQNFILPVKTMTMKKSYLQELIC